MPNPPPPKMTPSPASGPRAVNAGDPCEACPLADCESLWKKYDGDVKSISKMADPIARNKKISAAYAGMYLRNPELEWSGAAAFASKQVGCGMVSAKEASQHPPAALVGWIPGLPSTEQQKSMAKTMLNGLGKGNQAVFEEMYPAMRFYEDHGVEKLQACADSRQPPLPPSIVDGFKAAARGETSKGAVMMLENEQKITLQKAVYDEQEFADVIQLNQAHASAWYGGIAKKFGAEDIKLHLSAECNSGPSVKFTGKNLADYDERWPYAKSVADAFHHDKQNLKGELIKIQAAGE